MPQTKAFAKHNNNIQLLKMQVKSSLWFTATIIVKRLMHANKNQNQNSTFLFLNIFSPKEPDKQIINFINQLIKYNFKITCLAI